MESAACEEKLVVVVVKTKTKAIADIYGEPALAQLSFNPPATLSRSSFNRSLSN